MTRLIHLGELDTWCRCGHGKGLEFFATDEELQEWLLRCLPRQYRPYRLLAVLPCKVARRHYLWRGSHWHLGQLGEVVQKGWGQHFLNLWIWSQMLSPGLPVHLYDEEGSLMDLCGVNGLINIQRDVKSDGTMGAFSIGIVHRFFDLVTGKTVEHSGYCQIFETLRKAIERELVYSSIHVFPDGSTFEETRLQRMTAGAVEAYKSGVRFANLPGRYLGPMK